MKVECWNSRIRENQGKNYTSSLNHNVYYLTTNTEYPYYTYIGFTLSSVHLSVRPSVCLFLSVDMILSTYVLWNGCMDFSETLITHHVKMCTWNFILIIFLHFTVLNIMKNFDLNLKMVLFLKWNVVFTIRIYNIGKQLRGGGGVKYTLRVKQFESTVVLCTCLIFLL